MSTVACPDCGRAVPAQKSACAACGRPLWRKPPAPYSAADADPLYSPRQTVLVGYLILGASFLLGPVFLVSGIIGFVKRDAVRGTWLESHCTWLIDTVLVSLALLLAAIGGFVVTVAVSVPMGLVLMLLVVIAMVAWMVYRTVRGWMLLEARKPASGLVSPSRW